MGVDYCKSKWTERQKPWDILSFWGASSKGSRGWLWPHQQVFVHQTLVWCLGAVKKSICHSHGNRANLKESFGEGIVSAKFRGLFSHTSDHVGFYHLQENHVTYFLTFYSERLSTGLRIPQHLQYYLWVKCCLTQKDPEPIFGCGYRRSSCRSLLVVFFYYYYYYFLEVL